MKGFIIILISTFFATIATAQSQVEMADNFRGEGKIYIVVAVLLIILAGIFVTLWRVEKRIKKLEEQK